MTTFNLSHFCEQKKLNPTLVRSWLILNCRSHHFETSLDLSDSEISLIYNEFDNGINRNFNLAYTNSPQKAIVFIEFLIKKRIKIERNEYIKDGIRSLKDGLSNLDSKLNDLESRIASNTNHKIEKEKFYLNQLSLEKSKLLLSIDFKNNQLKNLLEKNLEIKRARFNLNYYIQLKNKLIEIFPYLKSTKVNDFHTEAALVKTEVTSSIDNSLNNDSEIDKNNNIDSKNTIINNPEIAFVPWTDVIFGEGVLYIKIDKKFLERILCKESRISFNALKSLYQRRNLAPLEIEYKNNRVIRIINLELLEFIFLFFENSGATFNIKKIDNVIKVSNNYNKSFYRKYFASFFVTDCFAYLIQIADNELPIIPLPERVINGSGIESIHESFLFPINKNHCYYWVWESIEENKATYVFQTSKLDYVDDIQSLYDFFSSEFENKRFTLIRKLLNSDKIILLKRFKHTVFSKWKENMDNLVKYDDV